MQIISLMSLFRVILYNVLAHSWYFTSVTGSNISFWIIHLRCLLENLILSASCEVTAQMPCSEWFMWSTCSFWALYMSYGLKDLVLSNSYRELTWRSCFRRFTQITSSEIVPWVIRTMYWLINITLSTSCELLARKTFSERFIQLTQLKILFRASRVSY